MPMMLRVVTAMIALGMFGTAVRGHAAPPAAPPVTVSLEQLFDDVSDRLLLQGERDRVTLPLFLPDRWASPPPGVRITFTNSADVMPESSSLTLGINGKPAVRLPVRAATQPLSVEIGLPAGLLQPGRNTLSFDVEHTHRVRCGISDSYQLWTRVDPLRSGITFPGTATAIVPSTIDEFVLDPRTIGKPLELLVPGGPIEEERLAQGALIAEALALRLNGRAPHVVARSLTPGRGASALLSGLPDGAASSGKAVLFGTAQALDGVLAPSLAARITGPFAEVVPNGSGTSVLVVSGRTESDVARAALSLAGLIERNAGRELAPGTTHRLGELGYVEQEAVALHHKADVDLLLPVDALAGLNAPLALSLSFAYAAGLPDGAEVNIYVNERWGARLGLDRRKGALLREVPVTLPGRLLRPGQNRLTFEARLGSDSSTGCAPTGAGPLFVLFADSTLRLPDYIRLARAPDLRLLADSAFPLTGRSDSRMAAMLVTARDTHTVSAAWTLAARLAQAAGTPLTDLAWRFSAQYGDEDVIVVGPSPTIPMAFGSAASLPLPAPLQLAGGGSGGPSRAGVFAKSDLPDTILRDMEARRQQGGGGGTKPPTRPAPGSDLHQQWEQRLGKPAPGTAAPGTDPAAPLQGTVGDLLDRTKHALFPEHRDANRDALLQRLRNSSVALITAFNAPQAEHRVVHLITAGTPEVLERRVAELVRRSHWSQLDGDSAVWGDDHGNRLEAVRFATPRYLDKLPLTPSSLTLLAGRWLGEDPLRFAGLALLVLAGFTGTTWTVLLWRKRRLFPDD